MQIYVGKGIGGKARKKNKTRQNFKKAITWTLEDEFDSLTKFDSSRWFCKRNMNRGLGQFVLMEDLWRAFIMQAL